MPVVIFWHIWLMKTIFRFDLSGKCNSEVMKEELEEKRRGQVCIPFQQCFSLYQSILGCMYNAWGFDYLQMVAKLHAILRPFLLRRMKSDVEQMLPGKKEIILYATMTEHQRNFQDHLINKTLENHLREKVVSAGSRAPLVLNCRVMIFMGR